MQNYQKEKVLRCTPDGKITFNDVRSMQEIVNDCLIALEGNESEMVKCSRTLAVAKVCMQNKYYHTALDLLKRVGETAMQHLYRTNRYSCQAYHYQAAQLTDYIWKKIAPGEHRVSEYAKTVYRYMSYFDDHEYCYYGIDNEDRFDRIKEFGTRHGIIDDHFNELS